MKTQTQRAIVVVNDCFGSGVRFNVRQAEWNDKTVSFRFLRADGTVHDVLPGTKHLRRTQTFAVATRELVIEANAINKMQERVNDRARKFRERLKELQVR